MADQLVTPTELASFLQQDLDLSTANLVINLATAKVQAACGQRLIAATSTAVIGVPFWSCEFELELPQLPVRTVSSVAIDGTAVTDYYLRSQKLWRALGWQTSAVAPSQVTVVYSHGYDAGAQGLELARDMTLALAGAGYISPGGAVASEQIDDYRVTYADADARMQLTKGMRDLLRNAYGRSAYVTTSDAY